MAKKVEIIPNLTGDLLLYVMDYEKLRDDINKKNEELKKLKEKILEESKKLGINKAKSQIFSFSWKNVKKTELSKNKLKEILVAKGMQKIVKDCEYEISFDQIFINKRKGGENIF